jgi:hypothetical protein
MEVLATIEDELDDVAGHLNAQHARLVDLTIRLLADEGLWAGPGVWTVEQFLAWRVGIAPNRARQVVEIARRGNELPECLEAFRRGELAVDQMAAVATRAPWWTDTEMVDLAKAMTVRQLRSVLGRYPFPDIPAPGAEAEPAATSSGATESPGSEAAPPGEATGDSGGTVCADEPDDRCSFHFDDGGRFHLHLDVDETTGRIVEAALVEARDALFQDGNRDVDWVDALREIAERSLDSIPGTGRRHRFRINIHVDAHGGAVDARGARLPELIRRYVTCEGLMSPVITENGFPVSVGRTQHIVPDRTRRLVMLRDQGCRVRGCTQTHFLEVHHIVHWEDLGPTDTWNLICLCPHHHRLHHRGKLGITGNADEPDGVVFTHSDGRPIASSGARPKPPGGPPSPPIGTYRHPDGGRLDGRWLYFNPPPAFRNPLPEHPQRSGRAA